MSVRAPSEMEFAGQHITLWTFSQLECLSKEKLRARAVDLRTNIGADQMPPVPRHPDDVLMWILRTQSALTGSSLLDFGIPRSHHLLSETDLTDAPVASAPRATAAPASPTQSSFNEPPPSGVRAQRGRDGQGAAGCMDMGSLLSGGSPAPSPSGSRRGLPSGLVSDRQAFGLDGADSVAASDVTDVSRAFQETRSVMHSLRDRNRGSGGLW